MKEILSKAAFLAGGVLAFSITSLSQQGGTSGVKYFPSTEVNEAFSKGAPIYKEDGHNYKITTGRREKTGTAELHTKDTDVFYIVDGSATFVTGGKLIAQTGKGEELRGTGIEGGETRHLVKGDVIIIPANVPHWFKSIEAAPFLYFVVKVQ